MAHQQYLLEQLFNLIGVLADELSQGGEVRYGIAGQCLENDVGLAAPPKANKTRGVAEDQALAEQGRTLWKLEISKKA